MKGEREREKGERERMRGPPSGSERYIGDTLPVDVLRTRASARLQKRVRGLRACACACCLRRQKRVRLCTRLRLRLRLRKRVCARARAAV